MDRSMLKHRALIGFGVIFVGCFVAATARTYIGIDIGTTDSCVAFSRNGDQVEIIRNDLGELTTPSWVSFDGSEVLVGTAAKDRAANNPLTTFFGLKRLIGRSFDDAVVQREIWRVPYNIVNKDGEPYISLKTSNETGRVYSVGYISSYIMTKLRENAEASIGENISFAVLTYPAHFNSAQTQATAIAGLTSGLQGNTVIREPVAVAMAYGLHEERGNKINVVVFDLGGGSFEASILAIQNGVIRVLNVTADAHLGGEFFDERIVQNFVQLFKEKHGKDISTDRLALGRLRWAVEFFRPVLNFQSSVQVVYPYLFEGLEFSETLTRDKFECLNDDLFNKTIESVDMIMSAAGLQKNQIDKILLSGKSSRIPKVQQLLEEYFDGKKPTMDIDPDVVVAYGAAIRGAILSGVGGGKDEDDRRKLQII